MKSIAYPQTMPLKKRLIRLSSSLFPSFFARIAYEKLTHPQVHKLREHELEMLEKAQQADFKFYDFDIKTYTWNEHGLNETILLIHGWEGQAGNFSDLVHELVAADYKVIAFDGPSHGFSSKGSTSLFEFTELVGIMIRKFEAKNLISHSFGGVATTYALSANLDLDIDKYALFTTPDKFSQRIDFVADNVGISPKVKVKLIRRLEEELNMDVSKLNVSEFVKTIHVREALILHDAEDQVLPIEQSLNVHQNWGNSRFETVEGTGHFRILRTKIVLDKVIDFFQDERS